jgi:hypothetical protein
VRDASTIPCPRVLRLAVAAAVVLASCGTASTSTPSPSGTGSVGGGAAPSAASMDVLGTSSPSPSASGSVSPTSASQAPDTGGGTTSGDVPDNAVFLTYRQAALHFSIQYVEGWQVTTQPDGVVIRDKDSGETVTVAAGGGDPASYVSGTDLPALRSQTGFSLVKQDTVKVGSRSYVHLVFHIPSPPDPVTGKQVPTTVDRYYVPGTGGLAIVSLATPDGVDNVDAFRQMIASFTWP